MTEVHGAHNHGRYETIWLNRLRNMPNFKVLRCERRPVGRINATDYFLSFLIYPAVWLTVGAPL